MSLKRRNHVALILIFFAAICWTFGLQLLGNQIERDIEETMVLTIEPNKNTTPAATRPSTTPDTSEPDRNVGAWYYRTERALGFILSFTAVASAGIAIFVFWQKDPVCGSDGISLLLALLATVYNTFFNVGDIWGDPTIRILTTLSEIVCAVVVLFSTREMFGWMRARFSLSWCLAHRAAKRCSAPQMSLLILVGWIILALTGIVYSFNANIRNHEARISFFGYSATAILGFLCLWKYGSDLDHFKKQLDNYQHGNPITVGDGAFSQTEAQLLDVQAQHEEAVRTAVTSERFKVDLISNVSHDLRTPLTSILGYSELLQKETMSTEGQEQLYRLQQKAGYMNDLVESLFELTKVSSGVAEGKKEQIDLICLLEQTIGLFDDLLAAAGLTVRRSYGADSIPVITDGARMHQVFANLLGNAIKYALTGTRIYLEVKETDRSYFVRMTNTASYEMNFKPDEIMQRFARGDKARSTKGSGLGLAIAQTYTESVGGAFRVSVDGDQFSAIVELPKD